MNSKLKLLLLPVSGIIVVLIVLCFAITHFTQKDNATMKMAIFPTGTAHGSYYFELKDKTLICSFGIRRNNNIKEKNFLQETLEVRETELTAQNLQNLLDMADELQASGYTTHSRDVWDSWDVLLLYNGKVYQTDCWDNESEIFGKIISEVRRLSPILVDLHGFS